MASFLNFFKPTPSSVSKYFSIADLTRTDTGLTNKPSSADMVNIAALGKLLDELYEKIGPFKIVSAYRAPAVQTALKTGGNVQAVSKSYHSTGQAADIMPTNQSVQDYFAKINNSPAIKGKLGAFAIKTNVIHLDTDTSKRVGVPMWVDKAGNYIRFTTQGLQDFVSKNKKTVAVGGGLIVLIGAAVAAYLYLNKDKK